MLQIKDIFEKIAAEAEARGLSPRDTNVLRLLGEEMFGMADNLVDINDIDFFITGKDNLYELHLAAKADISPEKKKEFVEASSSRRNEKEKGLMGKIKGIFSDLFYYDPAAIGMMNYDLYGGVYGNYHAVWSMENYLDSAPVEEQKGDWDGLEKSILINMADNILIGATASQVEMIVKKEFN